MYSTVIGELQGGREPLSRLIYGSKTMGNRTSIFTKEVQTCGAWRATILISSNAARTGTLERNMPKQERLVWRKSIISLCRSGTYLACSWDIIIDRSCCLCQIMRIQTCGMGIIYCVSWNALSKPLLFAHLEEQKRTQRACSATIHFLPWSIYLVDVLRLPPRRWANSCNCL